MQAPDLRLLLLMALMPWCAQAAADSDPRAPLTIHDVGEYAAIPWGEPGLPMPPGSREDRVRDLTFSVATALVDKLSDEDLDQWARIARWGRQQGKKLLVRVVFWDGADRYEGPMRGIEVYWRRLDRFLGRVGTRDLHGISLDEENVHYGGRPQVLTELYRRVKAKYGIPVWQWWSPATAVPGSGGWIPADGWIIDPYMIRAPHYRQYLRKYAISGKPVIVMPWSSAMGGGSDQLYYDIAPDQLEVAVEFGLPVAFFWCQGNTCYFGADRSANTTLMDRNNQRVWEYIRRVRSLPAGFTGHASADFAQAPPVRLAAETGYTDDFSTSRCVDDASMSGFRDLVLDADGLGLRGFGGRLPRATLVYSFVTDAPGRVVRAEVHGQTDPRARGRFELQLSGDGRDWSEPAVMAAGHEGAIAAQTTVPPSARIWMRLRLSGEQPGSPDSPVLRIRHLQVTVH